MPHLKYLDYELIEDEQRKTAVQDYRTELDQRKNSVDVNQEKNENEDQ